MSEAPQLKVSAQAEKALREAMERLFTGRPARTDGKLTKNNLDTSTREFGGLLRGQRAHCPKR